MVKFDLPSFFIFEVLLLSFQNVFYFICIGVFMCLCNALLIIDQFNDVVLIVIDVIMKPDVLGDVALCYCMCGVIVLIIK